MVNLLKSFREEVACCRINDPWPNFCLVAGWQNSRSITWICWNLAMSQAYPLKKSFAAEELVLVHITLVAQIDKVAPLSLRIFR